jgi:hypothetical protein
MGQVGELGRWEVKRREGVYFDMTWVMRVLGSLSVPQASMRACRLDPLPDIRTTRLCCESAMSSLQDRRQLWSESMYLIAWVYGAPELTRVRYRKFWTVG